MAYEVIYDPKRFWVTSSLAFVDPKNIWSHTLLFIEKWGLQLFKLLPINKNKVVVFVGAKNDQSGTE